MFSTERGREALKYLHDNDVAIKFDDTVDGAFYTSKSTGGGLIVMGPGYDSAVTLIHETNHAEYQVDGKSANINIMTLSRDDYINGMIAEEAAGTIQEVLAAKEFRVAGFDVPNNDWGEQVYDNAYKQAMAQPLTCTLLHIGCDSTKTKEAAQKAAEDAVYAKYFDPNEPFTASNTDPPQSYVDYYGAGWDRAHAQ
jgi:hypothetical protein